MNNRESLNIVVVGHVDHGKSTLIGRLLYDTDSISKGAIDKVKRISSEKGKSFEYAYLLDAFEEEQKQGITIDTTRLQFKTDSRDYVIIDAPGHVEFLKNMISGAASAEGAILMVDAEEGIKEQSKRHGYILSLLGIKKVYVAVNKMDLVGYSEERYKEIERDFNQFLNPLGVHPIAYIPISAYYGENITSKSSELSWYSGENIIDSIDSLEKEPEIENKELRFPIQDVYKFDHRRIIAGRIESGSLSVGDEITIHPSGKQTKVKTIEYWQESDEKISVKAGESVGITVEDEFFYNRGDFITHRESNLNTGNRFRGNVFWLGREDLVPNKKYKLKLSTAEVECQVEQIIKAIDASTLAEVENPDEIKKNDVGEVIIKTKSEIGFDLFNELENTGRFVIVDDFDISGGGIILGKEETELETESEIAPIWSVPKDDKERLKEVESIIVEAGRYSERILHDESVESLIEKLNYSIGSGNVPIVVI